MRQEFAQRRRRNRLTVLPGAAAIVAVTAGGGLLGLSANLRFVPALVVAAGVLWLSRRTWRCPACHRYLGKSLNPVACRHCDFILRT